MSFRGASNIVKQLREKKPSGFWTAAKQAAKAKRDADIAEQPFLKNVNTEGLRWRLVDARGWILGRLATHISTILQGKDKPNYAPHKDLGDIVVVTNAKHIEVTGRKLSDKTYRWHTGYPGGLKSRTLNEQIDKDPTRPLWKAVYGMLPKNKLRKARARKLRIFADENHGYDAYEDLELVPYVPAFERKVRWKGPSRLGAPAELREGFVPTNPEYYERIKRVYPTQPHEKRYLAEDDDLEIDIMDESTWPKLPTR